MHKTARFHEGELQAQRNANESDLAARNGANVAEHIIRPALPFVRQQTMAYAGSRGDFRDEPIAVREAARVRLYERVPWLDAALIAAVQTYAGDIRIDTDAIEEKLRDIDPQDAEALQGALAGNLFSPEPSDAQKHTLAHLENLLALVEGWVDVVTDAAVAQHLPNAAALSEVVRRRRASAGPAEKVFSSLVGLELRPRRLREAAALWTQLTDATDATTRDGVWSHPDHVPSATDLDDPSTFIARASGEETPETGRDEMDDALDALLAQGLAEMGESSSAGGEGYGGSSTGRSSSDDASAGAASGEQAAMNPRDPRHDGLADRADEAPGEVDSAGSAKGGTSEDEGGAGDGDGGGAGASADESAPLSMRAIHEPFGA